MTTSNRTEFINNLTNWKRKNQLNTKSLNAKLNCRSTSKSIHSIWKPAFALISTVISLMTDKLFVYFCCCCLSDCKRVFSFANLLRRKRKRIYYGRQKKRSLISIHKLILKCIKKRKMHTLEGGERVLPDS